MVKPRLLVTRFSPHGERLANTLNASGIFALAQPLLEVKKSAEFENAYFVFTKTYDYIIAVSTNAVNYVAKALSGANWPSSCYLAVGKATQKKLLGATGQQVIVPKDDFSSEGLLALPCLDDLLGKRVLILRGVGGRELLADKLAARGAVVDYYQPYQRIAIEFCTSHLVKRWQRQKINGAIISSVELYKRFFDIVSDEKLSWLKTLTIYVPSKRIAEQVLLSGCFNVKLLPGMKDQQIVDYFLTN